MGAFEDLFFEPSDCSMLICFKLPEIKPVRGITEVLDLKSTGLIDCKAIPRYMVE